MILTVGGIKGGTGKTTIATNLTIWLSKKGFQVLLIDADDQESAGDFTNIRQRATEDIGYTFLKRTGQQILIDVKKFKPFYQYIIIDSGGRDSSSLRAALIISDVVLLPFQPRAYDFWTVAKVEDLLFEIRTVNTALEAIVFLSRADARSSDNREAGEAFRQRKGFCFIDHPITNRKAFANAASVGLSVSEIVPHDTKATSEIQNLFDAIIKK